MSADLVFQNLRGVKDQWTSLNPVLAEGQFGVEIDTLLFKIGDGVTTWSMLPYQRSVQVASTPLALSGGTLSLSVGTGLTTSSSALVPDFGTTSGKVLSGAHAGTTSGVHGVTGNVVGTTDAQSLSQKTIVNSKDKWNIVAAAATGTINVDIDTAQIWYYTNNATANYTLNFRWNGSTSLGSKLAVGESETVTFLHTNGSTPYYPSAFQLDGSALTSGTAIKWQITGAPAAGDANAINAYTFTIIKTGSSTYTVLGSQTRFA